jgi:ribonucleoside-diphosphate reductase alpha chain
MSTDTTNTAKIIDLAPEAIVSNYLTKNKRPHYFVIRRDGSVTPFNAAKINVAITKAFIATEGESASGSQRIHEIVSKLTDQVVSSLTRGGMAGPTFYIEDIQDQVELALMRGGHHKVARSYVIYREERHRQRLAEQASASSPSTPKTNALQQKNGQGELIPLDLERLEKIINEASAGLENVEAQEIYVQTKKSLYNGISEEELALAPMLAARTMVEHEPNYSYASARLLLDKLRSEALSRVFDQPTKVSQEEMKELYKDYFAAYLKVGIENELIDPRLSEFSLTKIADGIKYERDLNFDLLGLQTLYDRYFLHVEGVRFEMPQAFFLRVAMGLAINEEDREARALEFYELLSSLAFMSSTPTLFNSGTLRPQLSSCFLTTVSDDLDGIFKSIKDNALLAKYSGGLGNDWTNVRGLGARIKGTNGKSQGVVPFLKVANDTAIAVNQGGKRKGAVCAYLESWHIDIEEFLDLRKNTGDDRRRTHDMNTANWIPDLFMERVESSAHWTLFSPDEVPNLHNSYGRKFKQLYEEYEARAQRGELKLFKQIKAVDLWRKMLTMLFETGHPWITFKDPCNIRSPQRHVGVVNSSNLCTEITLNSVANDEVAVCNLGSINLPLHIVDGKLDASKLEATINTAMRMLDNVIDINFYTIPEAKNSNLKHRPIGLGIMGFQDALQVLRIPYASEEAVEFADKSMELVSYYAISASSKLAEERGAYESFAGSLWSQGILPIDSVRLLKEERGAVDMDENYTLNWGELRERIKAKGIRNSNTLAIAPTATISNICGVSQSIEPAFQNLYVKSNMSGDFTVINKNLVSDLRKLDLWDEAMISDLKYYDGSLAQIARIPEDIKQLYATAFEVAPIWLIKAASKRQKWIDQSQSLNLYIAEPSGKVLDYNYKTAWKMGLKTTYYLRARSATSVEKSTIKGVDGKLNAVSIEQPKSCSINEPDCEACQ